MVQWVLQQGLGPDHLGGLWSPSQTPPGILTTGLCYNKFDVVPPLDLASKVIP